MVLGEGGGTEDMIVDVSGEALGNEHGWTRKWKQKGSCTGKSHESSGNSF